MYFWLCFILLKIIDYMVYFFLIQLSGVVMISKKLSAFILVSSLGLNGCQTTDVGAGETLGTLLGAAGGALLGSQVGNGNGKLLGVAIGALAGAYLGNQFGKMLDEEELAAVEVESAGALNNSADGQTVSWSNPDTGAQAEIQTSNTMQETQIVTVYKDRRIDALPPLILIGEEFRSLKSSNIRKSPSTDSEIVNGLEVGERFTAVGKVENAPWIVVAKNNRTVGFVHESLVDKANALEMADYEAAPVMRSREKYNAQAEELLAEGNGQTSFGEPIDLDAEGLVVDQVQVATTCRQLDMSIEKEGQQEANTFTACKATDGAWEIL